MKKDTSIAILGGMGPQASAKLLEVIIAMATKDYGAKEDPDFPEVIINSVPVPLFISDTNNLIAARNALIDRIKKLEIFNPGCFAVACNTAHVFIDDLQKNTDIPFISVIEEVTKKVNEARLKKVGLLATPVTINSQLYQKALGRRDLDVIIPGKQELNGVESVIKKILAGKSTETEKKILKRTADLLIQKGAQGIILGCTELPLIFPKQYPFPVFDSIEILAESLLRKYFINKSQPSVNML